MKISKTNVAIKYAYEKGYRVNPDGSVVSPLEKIRKLQCKKNNTHGLYLKFNIGLKYEGKDIVYPIAVHRLAAYQKFGERCFAPKQVIRHIDGNSLNNKLNNIAIGTMSDNMMDIPKEIRNDKAKAAGATNRRFTAEEVTQIRADHADGLGYKKLEKKWNTSRSTLSYFLSNKAKKKSLY
jgi:HNH endonuclease